MAARCICPARCRRNPRLTMSARVRFVAHFLAAVIVAVAAAPPSIAQGTSDLSRGDSLPMEPTRRLHFTTDEGTWMSLDVSPDGRTIVIDLLGDLYTLPIAGGTATRITNGIAFDAQPRWSPDGRSIAFVTDR